mgnify:CR=1 FL=1
MIIQHSIYFSKNASFNQQICCLEICSLYIFNKCIIQLCIIKNSKTTMYAFLFNAFAHIACTVLLTTKFWQFAIVLSWWPALIFLTSHSLLNVISITLYFVFVNIVQVILNIRKFRILCPYSSIRFILWHKIDRKLNMHFLLPIVY